MKNESKKNVIENVVFNADAIAAATPATRDAIAAALVASSFESEEAARAIATRRAAIEAEAKRQSDARALADEAFKLSSESRRAAIEAEARAKLDAARARLADGSATPDDLQLLQTDAARNFAAAIFAEAEAARAAIEATAEAKAARKALRDANKATSLSRALRDFVAALDQYDKVLLLYGIKLNAADLTPAIVRADNVTPFLLAPTPNGARVALVSRSRLHVVESWTPDALLQIIILNKLVTEAAAAAPINAARAYMEAARTAAIARAEADARAAIAEARAIDAAKVRDAPDATPADIEARDAIADKARAKAVKANDEANAAADKAAAAAEAARTFAGATPDDLDAIAAAEAEARKADALSNDRQNATIYFEKCVAFCDDQKKKAKTPAAREAVKAAKLDAAAKLKAAREAEAAALQAQSDARAKLEAAIVEAARADLPALYLEKVLSASEAMKQKAEADAARVEAKRKAKAARAEADKAADVEQTPEISLNDLDALNEAARRAEADADEATRAAIEAARALALELDALNGESKAAADLQKAARESIAA